MKHHYPIASHEKQHNGAVQTVYRPNPLLWDRALRFADGDVSRIVRISENEVLVKPVGKPDWQPSED